MRINQLNLIAFGPFTNYPPIDLSDGQEGLHIIYGRNEAGKSSALRALTSVLYGIDIRTKDNFVHANRDLKIGVIIQNSNGGSLEFIRRKGTKNTLLDMENNPIDEIHLTKLLGGVEEDVFRRQFGIDHDALVDGGKFILEGKGDVGEILFAAGIGISDLHEILKNLQEEYENLYKAMGSTPKINSYLSKLKDAQQMLKDNTLSNKYWNDKNRSLQEKEKKKETVNSKIQKLNTENTKLERFRKAGKLIDQMKIQKQKLSDMGDVIILPEDFSNRRRDTCESLKGAENNQQELQRKIQSLKKDIDNISIPHKLLAQKELIDKLHQDLGNITKADRDRRKNIEPDLIRSETEAKAILREIKPGMTLDQVEKLQLDPSQKTLIRDLGNQHQALELALKTSSKGLESLRENLAESIDELENLPEKRDSSELSRILKKLRSKGNPDDEKTKIVAKLKKLKGSVDTKLSSLSGYSGTIEELEKLPIPEEETIDRIKKQFTEIQDDLKDIAREIKKAEKDKKKSESELEKFKGFGTIPTEEELKQSRIHRDDGWKLIRKTWLENECVDSEASEYDPELPLDKAYEKNVKTADGTADHLRAETERVQKQETLLSDIQKKETEIETLKSNYNQMESEFDKLNMEWKNLWKEAGIKPLPPDEISAWIYKVNAFVEQAQTIRELNDEIKNLDCEIDENRGELNSCLEKLNEPGSESREKYKTFLVRCEELAEKTREIEQNRISFEKDISKLKKNQSKQASNLEKSEEDLRQWKEDWETAIADFGLTSAATPKEANAMVDKLDALFKEADKAEDLKKRLESIQRDRNSFEKEVRNHTEQIAPDLEDLPVEQVIGELKSRLTKAEKDETLLEGLEKQLEENEELLQNAIERIKSMEQILTELCELTKCSAYEELEKKEGLSDRAKELQNEIENSEKGLQEYTAGSTLEELINEVMDCDRDRIPALLDENSHELENLGKERSELDQEIGGLKKELVLMDGGSKAIEAAEDVQEILAKLRDKSERYIRTRLAYKILQKEIERYRQENQTPLLKNAGEFFKKLTLGSFIGLTTYYDDKDKPIILGVRNGGVQITVDQMSDGTRDQLYLALRLASIEQHIKNNEPFPVIMDDILIKFDDDRTRATLELLSDFSKKTQSILFTHHPRVVDLARETVPDTVLRIHSLGTD